MSWTVERGYIQPSQLPVCGAVNETAPAPANIGAPATTAVAPQTAPAPTTAKVGESSTQQASAIDTKAAAALQVSMQEAQKQVAEHSNQSFAASPMREQARATKCLRVAIRTTVGELAQPQGHETNFPQEGLADICRVRARDTSDPTIRRGDVSKVAIERVHIIKSFNGGQMPIDLSSPDLSGKMYPVSSGIGRATSKDQKILDCIFPGSLMPPTPTCVYNRVKQELMQLARITGTFNVDSLMVGLVKLTGTDLWLVPEGCLMMQFVQRQALLWKIPLSTFDVFRSDAGNYRALPGRLVEYVRQTIHDMHVHLRAHSHDVSKLKFNLRTVASDGTLTATFDDPSTPVLVVLVLFIEYQFLHPNKLLSTYATS